MIGFHAMLQFMKKIRRSHSLIEGNSRLLYSLIEYLSKKSIIDSADFTEYCDTMESERFLKEMWRDEDDARSEADDLHAGGIRSTVVLGKMAGLNSEKVVLDAGTGHGGAARVLVENFGCRVVGIDRDFVRLLEAIVRTKMLKLDHLLTFRFDDAYHTRFEDSCFDVVFRQHSVYGGEEQKFLRECHRILKENGLIAFQGTFKTINIIKRMRKSLEDFTYKEYSKLLEGIGFRIVEYETKDSTRELLDSYTKRKISNESENRRMIYLIRKNKVVGFKLIAQRA